jgi:hypothetical protein
MFCEIAIKDLGCQVFLIKKPEAQLLVHCVDYQLPVTWSQTAISHPHWTSGLSSPEFHVSLPDYEHKIGTKKNHDRRVRDEV